MRNSMTQQRRFTKEFEEEAVRLVQTSGRTQREIAGDLGIGLSTGRKRNSPSIACAACLVLVKAAISSGGAGQPAAANVTTWCCWHMSGRPLPCRTAPMAVPE